MSNKRKMRKYKREAKDLLADIEELNKQRLHEREQEEQMAKIKDEDLFVINEGKKDEIRRTREKLKQDRFKQYNSQRSKSERDKVKKIMAKGPISKPRKKNKTDENPIFDIWNTNEEDIGMKKMGKNKKKDLEMLRKSVDHIKRVVVPHQGQSYNPPAQEHNKLIENIVIEEINDVKQENKLELELDPEKRPEFEELPEKLSKLREF